MLASFFLNPDLHAGGPPGAVTIANTMICRCSPLCLYQQEDRQEGPRAEGA